MDEDREISFLAAHTTRLFEEQWENLLEDIQNINVNF